MDDAAQVSGVHGPRQRLDQLGGLARRLRLATQHPVQPAAIDVLQRQVGAVVVLADLVDLDDVGVLEAGDGLGLDVEAGQLGRAGVDARQHHLQGDHALEAEVPGLVDDAHAAAPQLPQDLVTRHRGQDPARPGGRGEGGRGGVIRLDALQRLRGHGPRGVGRQVQRRRHVLRAERGGGHRLVDGRRHGRLTSGCGQAGAHRGDHFRAVGAQLLDGDGLPPTVQLLMAGNQGVQAQRVEHGASPP